MQQSNRIAVVGNPRAGKTQLLRGYIKDTYVPTTVIDVIDEVFYDFPGAQKYSLGVVNFDYSIFDQYFIVLDANATPDYAIASLSAWHDIILSANAATSAVENIVVVINKSDLVADAPASPKFENVRQFCRKYNIPQPIFLSARNGDSLLPFK
jgi:signal recognition particle receptor subunit beta